MSNNNNNNNPSSTTSSLNYSMDELDSLENESNSSNKHASLQYDTSKRLQKEKRSFSDSHLTIKQLPFPHVREQSRSNFFKRMGYSKNDMEIVEVINQLIYLSLVILSQ